MDAWLKAHESGPRPHVDPNPTALLERFCRKSEAMASSVSIIEDASAGPVAVAKFLHENGLAAELVIWPELAGLPWAEAGISAQTRKANDRDLIGVTGCYCAIAETGTLMLLSGESTPAATSLLPETHIAFVRASRIVAGMEDGWALLRAERNEVPRSVNFVSGPSRTGDIEQTIVLGAHGPYRVHLLVVRGE
jgi:L-lactate dehydrogenase complex protein LldG